MIKLLIMDPEILTYSNIWIEFYWYKDISDNYKLEKNIDTHMTLDIC